jgi:hypothetical protein
MKIRTQNALIPLLSLSVLLTGTLASYSQALEQVDPAKNWIGYMSWSPAPGDAAGYGGSGGGAWGTAALQASFQSGMLVLAPNTNTYNATDPYWVNADGSGANIMNASFYVQDDTLLGQNVTFAGTCLNNTFTADYSSQAFIKLFDNSYNVVGQATSTLAAGQPFLISVPANAAATHVQYGFQTTGPDANPATADTLGQVTVAVPVGVAVQTDPGKFWAGYMNWQPVNPGSAYGGYGGGAWGTAALQAYFSGTNLFLLPNTNTYNPNDTYWVNTSDGTGANLMDANYYVTDDTLANTNVIFSGYCVTNSLAAGYTSQAFIKTFNADYSVNLASVFSGNLVSGQSFLINLDTTGAAHVQYGYATDGANANPTNDFGEAVVAASAPLVVTVLGWPTNNAPTPTLPAAGVIAMYDSSGTYPDSPGIGWYATWGSVISQGDYTITNTGAVVKEYSGLQYAGMEFYSNPINVATGFDTFHIDVWTPNANQLGIKLVSLNPTVDPQVNISNITSNHWVGLDIPFSQFETLRPDWDPSNLQQMLLVDNSSAGAGAQGGTFYVDNAYFYNSTNVVQVGPTITAMMSGTNFNLSFPTQIGFTYTVQYKTNLTDAVWQTLTSFGGNGSNQQVNDPAVQASRFYRLSIQ